MTTIQQTPTLPQEAMLAYRHPLVLGKLIYKEGYTPEDAEALFGDLMRFLSLCAHNRTRQLTPPRKIDVAWHYFILFTKDYAKFCEAYVGRFIHHQPFENDQCGDDGDCSSSVAEDPMETEVTRAQSVRDTLQRAEEMFAPLSRFWTY